MWGQVDTCKFGSGPSTCLFLGATTSTRLSYTRLQPLILMTPALLWTPPRPDSAARPPALRCLGCTLSVAFLCGLKKAPIQCGLSYNVTRHQVATGLTSR